ncbi:hypothetical protein RB13244 [Rhodopirellula baltica SH 1]|uniref:Uncharacterized protein n=1 Tax=Rhodopirellula baltica (strain DSM 10527 / NCIMB 13988 / SH1) TaxID=243090 RepID=Q7UHF1_RHOBA|nr:hypothetical protein RB13244 [Rhodopirellula baltica SH 1]
MKCDHCTNDHISQLHLIPSQLPPAQPPLPPTSTKLRSSVTPRFNIRIAADLQSQKQKQIILLFRVRIPDSKATSSSESPILSLASHDLS